MLKVFLDHELSCQTNSEAGISSVKYSIYKGITRIDVMSMESTDLDNDDVEIYMSKSLIGSGTVQVLIEPEKTPPKYGDANRKQAKIKPSSIEISLKINSESVFERMLGIKDSLVVGLICNRGEDKCLLSIIGRNDVQGNFADTTHTLSVGDRIAIENIH